jgi:hypothetical protein
MLFVVHGGGAGVGVLWGGVIVRGTGGTADVVVFGKEPGDGGHLAYARAGCTRARIIRGKVHSGVGGFGW